MAKIRTVAVNAADNVTKQQAGKELQAEMETLRELLRSRSAYDPCLENTIRHTAQLKIVVDCLHANIRRDGVNIETSNTVGARVLRPNPSCELLSKFSKDYQNALSSLGLTNKAMKVDKAPKTDKLSAMDDMMAQFDND